MINEQNDESLELGKFSNSVLLEEKEVVLDEAIEFE